MNRFSEKMEGMLRMSGWFTGRKDESLWRIFEFELHSAAAIFISEFGGIFVNGHVSIEADIPNIEYLNRSRLDQIHLINPLPVARTNYWTDSCMWIDLNGFVYLVDEQEAALMGCTIDEGFERITLLQEKPAQYASWKLPHP